MAFNYVQPSLKSNEPLYLFLRPQLKFALSCEGEFDRDKVVALMNEVQRVEEEIGTDDNNVGYSVGLIFISIFFLLSYAVLHHPKIPFAKNGPGLLFFGIWSTVCIAVFFMLGFYQQ